MMRRFIIAMIALVLLGLALVVVVGYLVHRYGDRRPVIIYMATCHGPALTRGGISRVLTAGPSCGSSWRAGEAHGGPEECHDETYR